MTTFDTREFYDNESLDVLERKTKFAMREDIAKALASDLAMPLPEDTEGRRNALQGRNELFYLLKTLNTELAAPNVNITSWDEIPDIKREWLLPNWLPANTVTMFTGQGGAGKSWLTLQIICQVACGFSEMACLDPNFEPLSTKQIERRHVVLATYEDEPAEIKRRLYALASGMSWIEESFNDIKSHVHIVDMRGIGSVWGPGMGKHIAVTGGLLEAGVCLQKVCEARNAQLLVLDPLSGAFGGNENDRTAVYDFVSSFRAWGDTAKCAMLVIGHLPKSSAGGQVAKFSGSTAWEASARALWMLGLTANEDSEPYWALQHTKSNYAPLQDNIPLIKQDTGWWVRAEDIEAAVSREKARHARNINGDSPYPKGKETEDIKYDGISL